MGTKTLGRIDKFKGGRREWLDWRFAFKAFLGGTDARATYCLNWAAAQNDPINDDATDLEDNADELRRLDGQVYTALSLLAQGDALDKLRQAPEGCGLEPWRRIVTYDEPMNMGHKLKLLHQLLNPTPVAGQSALKTIELWEESISKYQKRSHPCTLR